MIDSILQEIGAFTAPDVKTYAEPMHTVKSAKVNRNKNDSVVRNYTKSEAEMLQAFQLRKASAILQ